MAAEDVEALRALLAEAFDEWLFRMHGVTSSCRHEAEGAGLAETILASDWLAAHTAAAEDRVLQEALAIVKRACDGECKSPGKHTGCHAHEPYRVLAARVEGGA